MEIKEDKKEKKVKTRNRVKIELPAQIHAKFSFPLVSFPPDLLKNQTENKAKKDPNLERNSSPKLQIQDNFTFFSFPLFTFPKKNQTHGREAETKKGRNPHLTLGENWRAGFRENDTPERELRE